MTRDPWKLVTDEAQLRAGICCELRTCSRCGKRDRFFITAGPFPAEPVTFVDEGVVSTPSGASVWEASGSCQAYAREKGTLFVAIRRGQLYALIDDDTAADETTVMRRREMVE